MMPEGSATIDIKKATHKELLKEYERCDKLWGMWSCDSFGYYLKALHRAIVVKGGWPRR